MSNGAWKTINGARVFIEDGQSISEAFKNRDREVKSSKYMIDSDLGPLRYEIVTNENAKYDYQKKINLFL